MLAVGFREVPYLQRCHVDWNHLHCNSYYSDLQHLQYLRKYRTVIMS